MLHTLRRAPTCRSAGLTLIELLTTITIIGVIAAIAVPAYVSFNKSQGISIAVGDFVNTINVTEAYARSYAKPSGCSGLRGYQIYIPGGTPPKYMVQALCGSNITVVTKTLPTGTIFTFGTTIPFALPQTSSMTGGGVSIETSDHAMRKNITVTSTGAVTVN